MSHASVKAKREEMNANCVSNTDDDLIDARFILTSKS